MGRTYRRGSIWWITYSHNATKHRESSGSTKRPAAVALLKRRFEELGKGRTLSEAGSVLLSDLKALIDSDYQVNGRRSARRMTEAWAHLEGFFGAREKAVSITAPRLALYVTHRVDEGAAPATVRNELGALKRAFNLARQTETLLPNECPTAFPSIRAGNIRSGFFERAEHEAVRAALPPDEGDVAEFLFWTGWRKGEALGLRWSHVDLQAGVLRIETSKNREPRTLPFAALPQLAALLKHRREVSDAVQKTRGRIVSYVFHRNGEPIQTFYRSWAAACVEVGLGHEVREPDVLDADGEFLRKGRLIRRAISRIPHDYRRTAARNLSRAGVPEAVIMQLCGWKSRSVFDRYRIVPERDLAEGLAKLARVDDVVPEPNVARLKKRRARVG